MYGTEHGFYAMGYIDRAKDYYSGVAYNIPMPILIIAVVVFLVAFFGIISRFRAILKGKGTPLDFVGVIIMLILLAMAGIIVMSGVVKSLHIF
jgi:hypothetical protein